MTRCHPIRADLKGGKEASLKLFADDLLKRKPLV
jgi:hypothetical protein